MMANRDQVQPFERVKLVDPRRYRIAQSWCCVTGALALAARQQAGTIVGTADSRSILPVGRLTYNST